MEPQELTSLLEAYAQMYSNEEETVESLDEATLSAKAGRAGKDLGKKGKNFAKIAASAAKRYGSEESGKKVAGAVLAKMRAKAANEELEYVEEKKMKGKDPCWKGYQMVGTKMKNGEEVPNCVPEEYEIEEGLGLSRGISQVASRVLSPFGASEKQVQQGAANLQRNVTDPVGRAIKGGVRAALGPANPRTEDPRITTARARTAAMKNNSIGGPTDTLTRRVPRKTNEAYDVVLNYLISENLAYSVEDAENIMLGMSEAWIKTVMEQAVEPTAPPVPTKKLMPLGKDPKDSIFSADGGRDAWLAKMRSKLSAYQQPAAQ